jgi:hypothetical protein
MSARVSTNPLDPLVDALVECPATRLEPRTNEPAWRTLSAEAKRRGFPSSRAFRDWCRAHNVPVYGSGKHQIVLLAEVDSARDRIARSTPIVRATLPENDSDALSIEKALFAAGLRTIANTRAKRAK